MGYFKRMYLKQDTKHMGYASVWYKNGWISDGVTYGHRDLFRIGPALQRVIPRDDDTQLYLIYAKQPSAKANPRDLYERIPHEADHSRYYASMSLTDDELDKRPEVFWTNFVYQQRPEDMAYRIGYYFNKDGDRKDVYMDAKRYAVEARYWICTEHTFDWNRPVFIGCVRLRYTGMGYRRTFDWTNRRDSFGYRKYLFLLEGCKWDYADPGPSVAERERISELILHT